MDHAQGTCHGCQQITEIQHCRLCDHWFCEICWPKWLDRASEFVKQLVRGRTANCCGPVEISVPQPNRIPSSPAPQPVVSVEQRLSSTLGQLMLVSAQQATLIDDLREQLRVMTVQRDEARARVTAA